MLEKKHGKRHWAILEDYKDYIYIWYIYMHLFIYIIIDFFYITSCHIKLNEIISYYTGLCYIWYDMLPEHIIFDLIILVCIVF
jgi:hypothetical protein